MSEENNKQPLEELLDVVEASPPEMKKRFHAGMRGERPAKGQHEIPDVINTATDLSEYTVDCMEMFGLDAAATLNQYACSVEDALIEQIEKVREYREALCNIDIARKEADLENALLHRRLRLIKDLISRKQVDDIDGLMKQPL